MIAQVQRATEDHPLVAWTLDALRAECRRAAALRNGGIVSVTFARANGVPIARAISNFPDGSGFLYEGTVMIRFREALYTLTLQAGEHGSTGSREAITTGLLLNSAC